MLRAAKAAEDIVTHHIPLSHPQLKQSSTVAPNTSIN